MFLILLPQPQEHWDYRCVCSCPFSPGVRSISVHVSLGISGVGVTVKKNTNKGLKIRTLDGIVRTGHIYQQCWSALQNVLMFFVVALWETAHVATSSTPLGVTNFPSLC